MTKKPRQPQLPPVSEQMKAWSAALAGEAGTWPRVEAKSFFGFTALYRGERMFAALPRTRAMQTANSLAFKLENPSSQLRTRLEHDARIGSMDVGRVRWFTFEISSDADLKDVLEWLATAYDAAARSSRKGPHKNKKQR